MESGKTVVARDAGRESRWRDRASVSLHSLRSVLACPITLKDEIRGILYLDHPDASGVFGTADRDVVEIFAVQSAVALGNAEAFAREQSARLRTEKTLRTFSRFVPREFTSRFAEGDIESLETGLSAQEKITVLFSDIRHFTDISEKMSPGETFEFLNEYLNRLELPIRENGGFVDKFIGDAIMALFDKGARDAVRASLDMFRALRELNAKRGDRPIEMSVGLHFGDVMIGVVGSAERMDTTVLGDTVNIASRLESLTRLYGGNFLVTGEVHREVRSMEGLLSRHIDTVQVKGRKSPSDIHEIYNEDPPEIAARKGDLADEFDHALATYRKGDFGGAESLFGDYLREFPGDAAARVLLARCGMLASSPPPSWNGVFAINNK